jgi:prepilin signal peptidase PulO-like enzyme (type II secretory pathway)
VTVAVLVLLGFLAGFVLDELIARFAREPYERTDGDGEGPGPDHRTIELGSEAGVLAMPRMLTTAWPLRKVAVVAATAATFGMVGAQYDGNAAHLTIVALYASVLIVCAATDLLAYRVPNAVTYPAIIGALGVGMVIDGASRADVAFGGLLAGGVLFVPAVLTGGAMGMGDVKLALFIGFALGLAYVVPAMLLMAIAGGIVALVLLLTRLRGKGDPIPYAPFIAGAALFVLLMHGVAFRAV